jgi:UDP-N-acetylenolpyruvoylglucosamine reductase
MQRIEEYLIEENIPFEKNVSLIEKTWIKRGGIACFWITPTSINQLVCICMFLNTNRIQYHVVGYTSNLYFKNDYNPFVVISTIRLNKYEINNQYVTCECGVNVINLSNKCINFSLSGFEGLVSLPGTVASAVVNNSSCYGCSVSQMLLSIDFLDSNNRIVNIKKEDLDYKERTSIIKEKRMNGTILKIYLKSSISNDKKSLIDKSIKNKLHRKIYQEGPKLNLGSVFPSYVMSHFVNNTNKFILKLLSFFHKLVGDDIVVQNKFSIFFLFTLRGYGACVPYVSDKNMNCFIWKDEKADLAFEEYVRCIQKYSKCSEIEIEIIKN